jgi:hypothetical protein
MRAKAQCYAAEGVIIWGTAIASPKLAPFGKFTAAKSTRHESINTSLKSYIRKWNQISWLFLLVVGLEGRRKN